MFEKMLEPPPLPVVRDGKFLRRDMRAEYLTLDELMSQLRQQEIEDISEVRLAYLEPDGAVSVVRCDANKNAKSKPRDHSSLR